MIAEGALDGVDAIFGQHVWGTLDIPYIDVTAGPRMAYSGRFTVDVIGTSSHAATPHLGADAITGAAAIINNLQQYVSRMSNPLDPVVLTIGTISGGNRYNAIANHVTMEGVTRAYFLDKHEEAMRQIVENTVESLNRRYSTMQIVGNHLAELIPQGGTILTQCFGETIIGTVIRAARRQNKDFKVFCAETRPYLQGARLTSGCFAQMGFDTTVITDNMVAYAMEREGIDLFTSAADTIARDGHIANKIGTFQIAILAKYFGIPYYVTGIPDQDKHSKDDIVIEMRDPQQVLSYRGIPNTVPEVKAIYPSFDVVPPHLISGVVTDKGVYVPYLLDHYFDSDVKKFY